MKDFREFFQCCTSTPFDPQIIVNMQQKRRSISCKSSARRTFIKRSVGKNPILDLSNNYTNRSTLQTPKAANAVESNRIVDQYTINNQNCSFDFDMHNLDWSGERNRTNSTPGRSFAEAGENREKLSAFVKYSDLSRSSAESLFMEDSNQKMFELYETSHIKTVPPRLAFERRVVKYQESTECLSPQKVGELMRTMKTILETIEEKSSIPSMEGSQLHEMGQISSKATIRSNLNDKFDPKNPRKSTTEKCSSMEISGCKQSLRVANSQNLLDLNSKCNQQVLLHQISKLQIENSRLERQLNRTKEQQKFLSQHGGIQSQKYRLEMSNLQVRGRQYQKKLAQCKLQLTQMKQILQQRYSSSQIRGSPSPIQ